MAYEGCHCEDATALWCEEFSSSSSLNPMHWNYDIGGGGWGNGESQVYTRDNAVVEDDGLHIQVTRENTGIYYSSRLLTRDKVDFQYVRMEAKIKVSNLEGGLWPAFWFLGSNFQIVGWPFCGEIDVMELGSAEAIAKNQLHQRVESALHWDEDGTGGHVYKYNGTTVPGNIQDFHVYRLDWTPESVTTFVDDVEIFSRQTSELPQFQKPFFMLLNVAVGGGFTGILQPNATSGEMVVSWIRVYDNGSGSKVVVNDQPFIYSRDCQAKSSASLITGLRMTLVFAGVFSVLLSH